MYGFFRLNKFEHAYTFWADLENAFFIGFLTALICLGAIASQNNSAKNYVFPVIILFSLLGLSYALIRRQKIKNLLKQRLVSFTDWAKTRGGYTYQDLMEYATATKDSVITSTTLAHISNDYHFQNFLAMPNWTFFDFAYSKFRKTKYGEFKSADVYYGVIKTKLPRTLPNVFFDSKSARRRQFRFVFSKRQIYHFEGDFDKYFTTYIPAKYDLDSLSFITPDVMQALKAAAQYDAEIIVDEIYLYGPIFDYEQQIADMSAKVLAIAKTLALTTSSYHDDHIPLEAGWQQVSIEGSNLARSRFWVYVNIAGITIYILARIVLAAMGKG